MTALSYTLISFPGLGLELDPPSTIQLGPLTIHFYGLIIAVGMLLAVLYAGKRSKEFGLKEDDLIDGVLWVTPFAIICARLYYCIFEWDQYVSDPVSILYIWNGGLAIYGVRGQCVRRPCDQAHNYRHATLLPIFHRVSKHVQGAWPTN